MKIVKARFRTNEEFRKAYKPELSNGGLFVPTTTPLEAGSDVVIELNCDGLPNKVLIRAQVKAWRPALPRLRVRAGATVEFHIDEAEKRDFIINAMKGGAALPLKRRHTRIPVAVPVQWRQLDTHEQREGVLSEISIGGSLLQGASLPAVGAELVLSLMPPGGAVPMEIEGKITYLPPEGGAGVKFSFRDGGGARRLRELIRRIRVS